MRLVTRLRRRVARFLTAFGLVMLGLLATGPGQVAWGQTKTTCSPASVKGVDGPIDYGAYCWIDFTGLTVTQNGSQDFVVTLPGGVATLTFTLTVDTPNTHPIEAHAVPTWTGAAFGNFAFNGISGEPVIYQTNNAGGATTTVTLTNVKLNANGTSDLPFVFVAADGESTNDTESLAFTTSGDPWELVASPGENEVPSTPKLTYSNGNTMVTETGAGSGDTASYVFTTNKFTTNNIPFTVTAKMHGSGLQGVIFGVKYHTIGLSLTKTHDGEFKAGGIGSYTINVANTVVAPTINPPTDPQPVQVVDNLPTGLTYASYNGNGYWSCSASGQKVICNSNDLVDLSNGYGANPPNTPSTNDLPAIIINVNVASDAPATLTNNALVTDPTTSTLVFNVCEVAANGVCPSSATSTDGDDTTILHSNLSTSTKTVVDKNGGDHNPGDTLKYTITLKEGAGVAANNVNVTDDMPANVGDLVVVSKPAGSTDSSTATGGVNSTGKIDISGINVPANGSVTIVYDVDIAGDTNPGATIDNTATINNSDPNGTGATPAAPTITVAQSSLPSSGNKVLYLYDNTGSTYTEILNRVPQTANSNDPVEIQNNYNNDSFTWNLSPTIAAGKTLELPAQDVAVNLVMAATNRRIGNNRSITATLYNGNNPIGSTTFNVANGDHLYRETISISAQTIVAGSGLNLRVTNNSGGNRYYVTVSQKVADVGSSTISFNTSTVINVDSAGPYSDASCTTPLASTYEFQAGSTVYLCAVVSDPFGSADVAPTTAPSITITDADGVAQASGNMTQVADSGVATKTFEYTYTVPTTTSLGNWTAGITAKEGTEDTVSDYGIGTFKVSTPHANLSTSTKTVVDKNGGDAEPGDVLEYTITLKESAGIAGSNISVTDDMPAQVDNLTVVSTPAGSTNNSTASQINVSGISISANGSATIVYDVTVAAGTTPGTTIDNTATITGPDITGATPAAPTVTVSLSQVPASGNKLLYVYDNLGLTRTPQTAAGGGAVSIAAGGSASWTLINALAKKLIIKATSTISVNLMVRCNGSWCANWALSQGYLKWSAELYDSDGSKIGATSASANFYHSNYAQVTANIDVGSSDITIQPGHKLILKITEMDPTWVDATMQVEQWAGSVLADVSYVSLDVSTVINVDSVGVYDDANCSNELITPVPVYETNSKVYICTVVSDPFGSYDIAPSTNGTLPSITIKDASGTQQLSATNMTLVPALTTTATKTFEHTYTVPASPPATLALGHWTPSVTAWEGTEHVTQPGTTADISHTANGDFDVEAPNLVVVKSVSVVSNPVEGTTNPKALPGAKMRYSILITNQGKGPVDNNQLVVTDAIPANTTFVVGSVTGSGAGSGVSNLAPGDISYSNDGGSTWTYTPSGTTDPNVTNIKFSPQGSMLGKTDTTTPAYTITFDVQIQ